MEASTSNDHEKPKEKRRRRTKVFEAVQKLKPAFNPNEKKLEEYLDEYYKLDFEDIIAGQPTRFRYRNVVANSFGLSVDEILKAPDRELNAWCSLKKAVQHRSDQEEMYDMRAYKQKAALHDIKKKILPSLTKPAEDPSETATEEPAKKKRRRKKNKRATGNSDGKSTTTESKVNEKATETSVKKPEKTSKKAEKDVEKKSSNQESMTNEKTLDATSTGNSDTVQKKKRRKRNKEVKASETTETKKETGEPPAKKTKTSDYEGFLKTLPSAKISDARLEAYGQNPKRFRQKQKYVLLAKQRKPVDGT